MRHMRILRHNEPLPRICSAQQSRHIRSMSPGARRCVHERPPEHLFARRIANRLLSLHREPHIPFLSTTALTGGAAILAVRLLPLVLCQIRVNGQPVYFSMIFSIAHRPGNLKQVLKMVPI